MTNLVLRFSRLVAAALILLVAAQMSEAAALPIQELQQQSTPATPAPTPNSQTAELAALPEAPAPAQPGQASSSSQDAQQDSQKPVGTAAGPTTRPVGSAGSRPSGAAIAPAKQRRVKAIVIRVSLIVAGAAAAGAVIGLSKASPSRP